MNRFYKLTQSVPLRTTSESNIAEAFRKHLFFLYGFHKNSSWMTGNDSQHVSSRPLVAYSLFEIFTLPRTTHKQKPRQTDSSQPSMLPSATTPPIKYTRNEFSDPLTYSYYTQPHSGTGLAPFELV